MAIKGCKTIAEYAIRKWMQEQGFLEMFFTLRMKGHVGFLEDLSGDSLRIVYDERTKRVYVEETG